MYEVLKACLFELMLLYAPPTCVISGGEICMTSVFLSMIHFVLISYLQSVPRTPAPLYLFRPE